MITGGITGVRPPCPICDRRDVHVHQPSPLPACMCSCHVSGYVDHFTACCDRSPAPTRLTLP
jgi:hypothetical protein